MKQRNGYLRQGEFKRWASAVDTAISGLVKAVTEHGQQIAVVLDRDRRGIRDEDKHTAWKHTVTVVIAGLVSALIGVAIHWGGR